MNDDDVKRVVEAALMAADSALSMDRLMQLFEPDEQKPERDQVRKIVATLQQECEGKGWNFARWPAAGGIRHARRYNPG